MRLLNAKDGVSNIVPAVLAMQALCFSRLEQIWIILYAKR